ncbi:MAG: 4Fe-4S binding protein, partial [Thermoplasmata archaeon]
MSGEWILILLAIGMIVATAVLVKICAQSRSGPRAAGAVFLIVMMVAMLVGATIYLLNPGSAGLIDALWVSSLMMSLAVLPIFFQFLADARQRFDAGADYSPPPYAPSVAFALVVLSLVIFGEFLMGFVLELASGTSVATLGAGPYGPISLIANVVQSPWFIFTMAGEMALTVVLLRRELPGPLVALLSVQAAIMVLTPTALADSTWQALAIYGSSIAMIAIFVLGMEYVYRNREILMPIAGYLLRLFAVYGLMMVGLFLWIGYGFSEVFVLSLLVEMVLYFGLILRPHALATDKRLPWQLHPNWAFGLLATIFVAEVFMGALLQQQIGLEFYATNWFAGLGLLDLTGSAGAVAYAAFYNGFFFLASATASTWFLLMMGVEMGALVVYKFRETKSRETRVRLWLMIGSYGAFIVFYPSIYYSLVFPTAPNPSTVPLLGWSMGIGTEALAPAVFGVVIATYVIVAVLSMAFGRRWLCSVFCNAPLMFQGTTIDSMKSFNRSSLVGRKYLGSRFSTIYSVTMGVTMVALAGTSVLSYFDATGALNVTILGLDPTVFFFTLSFSVLWYAMFVMIPYTGNYNCVTMGWCYTGIIAQAFQKIGAFKLKVHDKQVCKDCTTIDCAKGCPVGLVDMVGYFRTKGEYRSTKCCGVGDCVEACPYGNLYIHDIRHVIGRAIGVDLARKKPATTPAHARPGFAVHPLPMLHAKATPHPSNPAAATK